MELARLPLRLWCLLAWPLPIKGSSSVWEKSPNFDGPRIASPAELASCPPGAGHSKGHKSDGLCRCSFGFGGNLTWDDTAEAYAGECVRTPCPSRSSPGVYPGLCGCDAGYRGRLYWRSKPEAHFDGQCLMASCPEHSSRQARPEGQEEAAAACFCQEGFTGGFAWNAMTQSFDGQCVPEKLCPQGFRVTKEARAASFAALTAAKASLGRALAAALNFSNTSDLCEPAPCPPNARINATSSLCHCLAGFEGTLAWDDAGETYTGSCTAVTACAPHAEHRLVRSGPNETRIACACIPGYAGGATAFVVPRASGQSRNRSGDGKQGCASCLVHKWFGDCKLVDCPAGAHRPAPGALCVCKNKEFEINWSWEHGAYLGFCFTPYVLDYKSTTWPPLPTTPGAFASPTPAPKPYASERPPNGPQAAAGADHGRPRPHHEHRAASSGGGRGDGDLGSATLQDDDDEDGHVPGAAGDGNRTQFPIWGDDSTRKLSSSVFAGGLVGLWGTLLGLYSLAQWSAARQAKEEARQVNLGGRSTTNHLVEGHDSEQSDSVLDLHLGAGAEAEPPAPNMADAHADDDDEPVVVDVGLGAGSVQQDEQITATRSGSKQENGSSRASSAAGPSPPPSARSGEGASLLAAAAGATKEEAQESPPQPMPKLPPPPPPGGGGSGLTSTAGSSKGSRQMSREL